MANKVLTATALALLVGVGAAAAQLGGEARNNDREINKALDDKHLSPIRPIRRVGEDSWPAAKNQPVATQENSAQNKPRETTGQAANKEEPAKPDLTQDKAKQEAKQEPVKEESAKQELTKPDQKQDTAKQDAPKPDAKPQDSTKESAQNTLPQKSDDKGFANIRLGTDKNGRVAVNDSQEKQISRALRKERIQTVDVAVTIGAVTPESVRLGSVSADIVAVLPQFRGYSYFATRESVVIVEPDSKKIVALVPVEIAATASRPRETTTERTSTTSRAPHSTAIVTQPTATVTQRETTGSAVKDDDVPSAKEILASPVVTAPSQTTVTRTYRPAPRETVTIEHYRRPRIFGLW